MLYGYRHHRARRIFPENGANALLSVEKARELIQLALTQGSHRFEWFSRRYDGSELPLDIVMTAIPLGERSVLFLVYRDISKQVRAESEIRRFAASLEQRVAQRTSELVQANEQLKRAEEQLRKRSGQVQRHRDVLLALAHSDKSDFARALREICSVSAAALDVARVSYWSLQENGDAIVCEVLHLRHTESFYEQCKSNRLSYSDCPAYFEALTARRPVVADYALEHPATRGLAENYLKPLGISSLLEVPVLRQGRVVGVLCYEDMGPSRHWSAEEIDFVSTLGATVSHALEESNRARSEQLLRESEARLRESEQRFSRAFRASPALMTISRLRDQKYVEANDAFVRWYGLDRDNIVGHDTKELSLWLNLEDRAKFWADLKRDGSVREVECQARNWRGAAGTLLLSAEIIEINREPHLLGFGIDITQRKQAEVELLRTLAKEKELSQLRSQFVSIVSHEFRTPLGIIQSSTEILKDYFDQLDPAERKDHLQSICNNTRRMAGLMEEVLFLGSFDAGKLQFKSASLEFRTFVERLVDEVLSATNRRCPIKLSLSEVPSAIEADERLLRHIFTNLLTNAIKYSEAGDAVGFEMGRTGEEIVCVIRDQGIGIPEADLEWLFNAFHRGQNVADRPGTGLGLVIVKRCVDLHGGKIKVESKVGQGSTVTVWLPISSPESPPAPSVKRGLLWREKDTPI
ncbi:MAG TPA: GAF domain-containing sensor histidine kinase, partial [Chthoniobacterales bacterium]|nr:GAF domain-containing sensor histidine kinase [Chthoniobacterales bacterium]